MTLGTLLRSTHVVGLVAEFPSQQLQHSVAEILPFLRQGLPDILRVDPERSDDDISRDGGLDDVLLLKVHLHFLFDLHRSRSLLTLVFPGRKNLANVRVDLLLKIITDGLVSYMKYNLN